MARNRNSNRVSRDLSRSEINLVSARSALSEGGESYSRNARQGGYAQQRSKRTVKRRALIVVTVILVALLVAGASSAFGLMVYLNDSLTKDMSGERLDSESLGAVMVDRTKPEDPFWMLLVGTDWAEDDSPCTLR